jgi:hypothetical protein
VAAVGEHFLRAVEPACTHGWIASHLLAPPRDARAAACLERRRVNAIVRNVEQELVAADLVRPVQFTCKLSALAAAAVLPSGAGSVQGRKHTGKV